MQTFLPYKSFEDSFTCIDNKRLGNQIYREGKTLLGGGWKNHPIAKMWKGYEFSLAEYCIAGVEEMYGRKVWSLETCDKWFYYFLGKLKCLKDTGDPPWLGDERVHASHRSNLLRKFPEHYTQFGWKEKSDLPYHWIK